VSKRLTTDEAQTATLLVTEGSPHCYKVRKWRYPALAIGMCDREALEPASRVFHRAITTARSKERSCPPEDFPPDGKGYWFIRTTGTKAEKVVKRLNPLLTTKFRRRWKKILEECT